MRLLLALCIVCASGFYLPGVSPKTYKRGERMPVKVDKLTSIQTELPYDFYSLPFPEPEKGIKQDPENLGEYLMGTKIENSPYEIFMLRSENCKFLKRQVLTKEEQEAFIQAIRDGYHGNMIFDNLPSAAAIDDEETRTQTTVYDLGYPIGRVRIHKGQEMGVMLNNHLKFSINYHPVGRMGANRAVAAGRIVGFLIEPISVQHKYEGEWDDAAGSSQLTSCYRHRPMPPLDSRRSDLFVDKTNEVVWTYDVMWRESKIKWASRWDIYLSMADRYDDEVHWFSIINALLIVLFLTGMVGMIMVRSLRRDIARYNRVPTEEELAEEREETGWKLVHRDVFRAPDFMPQAFAVLSGTGTQLLYMSLVSLFFMAIGFVSPANRGSIMIALLLIYVLMGVPAGYESARTYKMFKGKKWQQTTIFTAMLFPGLSFTVFFFLNLCVWYTGSTEAVPFGSMFAIVMLWFGISLPLVFVGAYIGYRKEAIQPPVNTTSKTHREIPEQPWFLSTAFSVAIGGVLPFGAVFVELFFILSSLWLNQYYYVFGFLLLVWIILIITCAEITIVLCYFQLCSENYHWWWRSFLTSGSSAFYVFLYSTYYYYSKVNALYFLTSILYFSYMFLISFAFFLLTGVVGYMSCFWFICKIYASIKVD